MLTEQEKEALRLRIDRESGNRFLRVRPSDLMKKYGAMSDEEVRALDAQDKAKEIASLQASIDKMEARIQELS